MSTRLRLILSALPLVLSLACAVPANAQESRATVNGLVQDSAQAVVPNADVTARNLATGVDTTVKSQSDGNYTIPFLVPGTYALHVKADGFKEEIRNNVVLHTGDMLTVNFSLTVGAVSEVVNVSGAEPLLDTGTASRGGLIDNVRVTDLPLVGRNPYMLAQLVPGVTWNGNPAFQRPFDNGDNANFSIDGGLRQTNAYLIDGAPDDAISDVAGDRSHANQNVSYIPSVEATQEFKIVNNFYDAQYGRTGGGIFNVSTKQGTDEYHGAAYYFMRRYQLDANSVSNKIADLPRYSLDPVTKANLGGHTLNDWGGEAGGPASIPRVFNAKDRTFFVFSYEHYHEVSPMPTLTSVPTAAERKGDFSAPGEATIYDPWSTRLDSTGHCCIRDAFPGNIIPQSRLTNSPGLKIANAYPVANVGGATTLTNNYSTGANTSEDHFQNILARIDQNFGQRERVYVRYAHGRRNQFDHGAYNFTGPLYDAQDPLGRTNDSAVVDSLTTFSAHMLLDLRASLSRYNETVARGTVNNFDDSKLGFSSNFNGERFVPVPPRISMGNTSSIPDAGTRNPRFGISNVIGFQPSLQLVYGSHSVHIGADIRNINFNTGGGSFVYGGGAFAFSPNFTQANPTATYNGSSGSSTASLLLGVPAASNSSITSIISYTPRLGYRWWYNALYVQDDWKLTKRFTLNAGVRYDIEGSPVEDQNRMNRGFGYTDASPLASAAKAATANCPACANLTGGLLFAGSGGGRSAFSTQYGDVQARVGGIYQLRKNTIVRGGFGMFYLPEAAFGAAQGFAQDTAYVPNNIAGGTTPDLYTPRGANPAAPPLIDPFPTVLKPSGSSLGLATFEGQSIIFNNVNRKIPRANQWSVGVEQQLPYNVKVDASYVGSHTVHINTNDNFAGGARNINVLSTTQIQSARTSAGTANTTAQAYLGQAVPNPFTGLLPGTNLNGATVSRQQLLLPYPQFLTVAYGQESVGQLWYNAAQFSIEKRYSHGFTILGAYTWSKTEEALSYLNPQDPGPYKNIGAADRPQRLVISAVYQLPFGRGQYFGSSVNRPMELLIGGWQLNYIETIQSGLPTGLNGSAYPILNPQKGIQKSFATWFNPCVRQLNGTSQMPNATHNGFVSCSNPAWQLINSSNLDFRQTPFQAAYIRNPNAPNADLSLIKDLHFTERTTGQFRMEAFNVTNTAVRGGANTSPTSTNFGYVAPSQSNISRQVQLGFKLNF
ncbi:MAG TPA: TonB-dependent receptor [Acidobacteriaceae bacterium]|nr:TonB-dependent receptor [Acidobacteriaceae bacterium]